MSVFTVFMFKALYQNQLRSTGLSSNIQYADLDKNTNVCMRSAVTSQFANMDFCACIICNFFHSTGRCCKLYSHNDDSLNGKHTHK